MTKSTIIMIFSGMIFSGILISLKWFKNGYIIGGGDILPYLNPLTNLYYTLFMWDIHNGGTETYRISDIISFFYGILYYFGMSVETVQKIHLSSWFLLPGITMYYLSNIIFGEKRKFAIFFACLFYVFNMFTIFNELNSIAGWGSIIMPLLLGIYIKGLNTSTDSSKYIILFSISTMALSYLASNPPTLVIVLLTLCIYFIYNMFKSDMSSRWYCIKFTFCTLVISFFLNLYWIFPFYHNVIGIGTGVELSAETSITSWGWTMTRNSFLNIFWLNTSFAWSKIYFPFFEKYSNPFVHMSTLVPTLLAISSTLFSFKKKHISYGIFFVSSFSLLLIFISKGIHPPFESIFLFIYGHIPFFWLFREPAGKFFFILILCYAILIGFSMENILEKIKNSSLKILVIMFILGALLLGTFPIITGELIVDKRPNLPSTYIQIPDYYFLSNTYINNDIKDFKILFLPPNDNYQLPYKWGYYGIDISRNIFDRSTLNIFQKSGYIQNYFGALSNLLYINAFDNGSETYLWKLINIMNAKYIFQRNDINSSFRHTIISSENITNYLNNSQYIMFDRTIGNMVIYKIKDDQFIPHIFTTIGQINISTYNKFLDIIKLKDFSPFDQNIIVDNQNSDKTIPMISSTIHPNISFQKNNPTKYKIIIEPNSEPFYLIFSESYNVDWKAYIDTDKVDCDPVGVYKTINVTECRHSSDILEINDITRIFHDTIPEKYHFVVNGYANGWYIDQKELGMGEKTVITIYFKPQSYLIVGGIISLSTFIICIYFLRLKNIRLL